MSFIERFLRPKNEYVCHNCTDGNCPGCNGFIEKLRKTPEGQEALEQRFRSAASCEWAPTRVCISNRDDQSTPLAICDAGITSTRQAEIAFITDPSERGKKHGEKAVRAMLEGLKKEGVTEAFAWIEEDNIPAQKLIQHFGGNPDINNLLERRTDREEVKWVIKLT